MGLFGNLFKGRPKVHPTSVRDHATFQREVLESDRPVIVDVWSPSCGPCKRLVPVLTNVATDFSERVRVVEISTEAEGKLLAALGVRSTPTLIIYDQGEELGRQVGYRPESWFAEMIDTEFPEGPA
ncbi:MAG: thioredoxin domain-containing protein [Myxococcota bacterium]